MVLSVSPALAAAVSSSAQPQSARPLRLWAATREKAVKFSPLSLSLLSATLITVSAPVDGVSIMSLIDRLAGDVP